MPLIGHDACVIRPMHIRNMLFTMSEALIVAMETFMQKEQQFNENYEWKYDVLDLY